MATRSTTRPKPKPEADEHTLVRLADACHYDQWCSDEHVFTRGAPPIPVPALEAERIVAAAAGALVMEESA